MIPGLIKKGLRFLFNNRILIATVLLIFFIITAKAYLNHIFFLDFADEEENFLPGKYILNGKKLYSDIFVQHQPIAYIASALIQKIISLQTISGLVKVHRFSIILWSALWGIILTLRFGSPLFVAILIVELTKISLLGNLFLAESLVVYPLIYIATYTILIKKDKFVEFFFVSLLIAFVFYNLLPLWSMILLLSLYLIFRSKNYLNKGLILAVTFLCVTIIVFQFSSLKDYFYNTVYITLKYYLPLTKHFSGTFSPLQGFFAPILALLDVKNTHLVWVIKALSLVLLFNVFLLLKNNKKRVVILITIILGLASIRYVKASTELYGAFHMLPWFSLLVLFSSVTSFQLFKLCKSRLIKLLNVFSIIFILLVAVFQSRYTLFDIRNPETDLHVHYSPHYNYADALRIMKKPNDTLFVAPVNMLIYWYSDIQPVSKYIYFYEWMEKTALTQDIKRIFTKNPPTFLYCVDCKKSVINTFTNNYHQLKKSGNPSCLYIRQDKLIQLTENQIDKLRSLDFKVN